MTARTPNAIRIDRLLSNLGYGSRREINRACRAGAVTLDGLTIIKAEQTVTSDQVSTGALLFNGKVIDPPAPFTIMLNKPAGYVCSRRDAGLLIYDLLPDRWRHRRPLLSSVGRLDKDSTGQLLLTDDGNLLHRIIHPRTHAPKHYQVTVRDTLRGDESDLFASGQFCIHGDAKPLRPAIWKRTSVRSGTMVLSEGRYHQIRRMFAAMGNHVVSLHRFQTGGLQLGAIAEGSYRILDPGDIRSIFTA